MFGRWCNPYLIQFWPLGMVEDEVALTQLHSEAIFFFFFFFSYGRTNYYKEIWREEDIKGEDKVSKKMTYLVAEARESMKGLSKKSLNEIVTANKSKVFIVSTIGYRPIRSLYYITHTYTHTHTHTHTLYIYICTVKPGYNDIGLCDTSSEVSDILWRQSITHS